MATNTTNIGLIKPAGTDKIRIAQINQNMDTIDEKVGAVGNTSLQSQIVSNDSSMAILSTGNTHVAITSGQFVYVRSHSNLAEGLYKATSNISANATLSTSNLSAISNGGFNDVQTSINTINSQINYTQYTNVASLSAFETILDNALSAAGTNKEIRLRITPSATFSPFVSGEVYFVDLKKAGSATYSTAIITRTASREIIKAQRGTSGWNYGTVATMSDDSTLMKRKVYTKTGITCTAGDPMSRAQQYSITGLGLTGYTVVNAMITRFSGSTSVILPLVVVSNQTLYLNIHRVSGAAQTAEQEVDITVTWVRNDLIQTFT